MSGDVEDEQPPTLAGLEQLALGVESVSRVLSSTRITFSASARTGSEAQVEFR